MPVPKLWEPPTPAAAEQIRSVAERLQARLHSLIRETSAAILGALPALESDPVLAAYTHESAGANIRRWVSAMVARPDAPVGVDAPPQALDLARDVVRRGMERDALLSSYRLGQNVVWAAWMRAARDEGLDGDDLIAVLDAGSRSLFGYVDGVLSAIATQNGSCPRDPLRTGSGSSSACACSSPSMLIHSRSSAARRSPSGCSTASRRSARSASRSRRSTARSASRSRRSTAGSASRRSIATRRAPRARR